MNRKTMFYALIVSSNVMVASVFTMNYKLLGFGLLQWVVILALAFGSIPHFRKFSFNEFSEYNYNAMVESWKERKLVKSATFALVPAMMIAGLVMVVLMIGGAIIFG